MKTIHTLLLALTAVIVPATVASADHQVRLDAAACRYHDAVKAFECKVNEVGFVDHYDLRLVHRLVDASCDLHSVSRYPDPDQVLCRWDKVQMLHRRVAAAIFARTCYPQHPVLVRCWEEVTCAFRELGKAIDCVCRNRNALTAPVGRSLGTPFGVPNAVIPGRVPHHVGPGTFVPPNTIPHRRTPNVLPHAFAPTNPRNDDRLRRDFATPPTASPLTDEIRYFGRRPFNHPSGRHGVDAHLTGNDFRSAMIGALLSRLVQ